MEGKLMEVPICRICKASSEEQVVRAEHVFGSDGKHKFWQCKRCRLVYLYPVPSQEEENHFYSMEFEKFMEKRSGKDRDWSRPEAHLRTNQDNVKRRLNFLNNYLKEVDNLLEIGCSSGFMLDAFRELGIKTVGIEPSSGFTEFLKSRGHKVYSSIDELLNYEPNIKFDLIVHFFVLEHIRNSKEFLQRQLDLLNPNGKIICEVPCVNDPLTSLYNIPAFEKFYWSIAHHYYFNPKSLSQVLDQLNCSYEFFPEQRYDLSNHLVWMQEGKPGGSGRYNHIFSQETLENYKKDLMKSWTCDTFFLYISKK
jgi:SAM-dependent methyltransferase